MLRPTDKGNIAEAWIVAAAIELGIDVYKPLNEGGRADLVFDTGPRLLRVQCKWASRQKQIVVVRARTSRLTPNGYVRTVYSAEEVDALAVYCPELKRCYLVPIEDLGGRGYMHLRLGPTENNQAAGIKWAADYELGAIAQLGERLAGSQKVAGSSPASSTEEAARQGGLFVVEDP